MPSFVGLLLDSVRYNLFIKIGTMGGMFIYLIEPPVFHKGVMFRSIFYISVTFQHYYPLRLKH